MRGRERECVGEENGGKKWLLAVWPWPAVKEKKGGSFGVGNEKKECCQMRVFSSFSPYLYFIPFNDIMPSTPPNIISLRLYLTLISKVPIPLPFMKYLYQQVWWGYGKEVNMHVCVLNPYTYILIYTY